MIRTIIIDDEESSRYVIRYIIEGNCPDIEIVGEADGVSSGIKLINETSPELVLLDIQLSDGTGFDLLRQLDMVKFKLIFITAYERYAIDAFKFSALNYLLKPVDAHELRESLAMAIKSIDYESLGLKLNAYFQNLTPDFENRKKIVLQSASGVFLINITDIIRCESIDDQTRFILTYGEEIIINKPLKEYVNLFSNIHFFRLSSNYLINLKHVVRFDPSEASNIVMTDYALIPFTLNKKDNFVKALKKL
ncbi:MAG: DNA-binding response regulator [Bacteroidetes bacterium HGW-Bacteroidetes-1]|jgi:two-component system LytT family response regulator|nr:MAG: DNA-binding response regulator [Bacteroidetes bacterium HGW-Bacteroidetes-1]